MYLAISALTRLIAPILAFTAEEIWQAMPHASTDKKESVYLNLLPDVCADYDFADADKWNELFALRDDVMKALEIARAEKKIGKSLDAKVTIFTADEAVLALLGKFSAEELATVFITSGASVKNAAAPEGAYTPDANTGNAAVSVLVENADGHRCDRCWCYSTDGEVTTDDEGNEGFICRRCAAIIAE
jgi:isoleucyl-tRNA synthetase